MKRLLKTVNIFAIVSAFICVAGVVYHHFGRGVFSQYMAHAFYYPLFLGTFVYLLLMSIQQRLPFVGTTGYRIFNNLHNAGIAALTLYSILMGVFEIAGGSSALVKILYFTGIVLVFAGLCVLCSLLFSARRHVQRRR